jgi:hypothetical protein
MHFSQAKQWQKSQKKEELFNSPRCISDSDFKFALFAISFLAHHPKVATQKLPKLDNITANLSSVATL